MLYTTGNAGDFIKHGVLIHTLDWLAQNAGKISYADPFGGVSGAKITNREIRRRLNESADLRDAWDGKNAYYGSAQIAKNKGADVFVSDKCPDRRREFQAGFALLDKFSDYDNRNGYCVLNPGIASHFDLILIDPYSESLECYMDKLRNVRNTIDNNSRLFIIMFVLCKRKDKVRKMREILDGMAYSLFCPVIKKECGIVGESSKRMGVFLASQQIAAGKCAALCQKLSDFADAATEILPLPEDEKVELWTNCP